MEIQSILVSSCNFKARKIAQACVSTTNPKQYIELYSLQDSDLDFVKKLVKKLDLKKLYPNENSYEGFKEWECIIKEGFARLGERNIVLAMHKKRPCGVMTYFEKDNQINLTHLAKWRAKTNEDVSFVGKILMHNLFDIANEKNILNISLVPSHCFPRGKSCRSFYSQFGFRRSANNTFNLFGADYMKKLQQLDDYFEYKKINNSSEIDLTKESKLNY